MLREYNVFSEPDKLNSSLYGNGGPFPFKVKTPQRGGDQSPSSSMEIKNV